MDDFHIGIYIRDLGEQLETCVVAYEETRDAITAQDSQTVWAGLDSFLGASIRVMNLLWPSSTKKSAQDRAAELRQVLAAPQSAPENLRDTRNGFEHFDERIDKWMTTTVHHNFVDRYIGPPGGIVGPEAGDFARLFDPGTGDITVFGQTVNIVTVMKELNQVRFLVQAYDCQSVCAG